MRGRHPVRLASTPWFLWFGPRLQRRFNPTASRSSATASPGCGRLRRSSEHFKINRRLHPAPNHRLANNCGSRSSRANKPEGEPPCPHASLARSPEHGGYDRRTEADCKSRLHVAGLRNQTAVLGQARPAPLQIDNAFEPCRIEGVRSARAGRLIAIAYSAT